MGQTRLGPLRVGIVPPQSDHSSQPDEATVESWLERHRVDYLALPRPFHRLRVLRPEQVAFCPGVAVPVTKRETGVRGAALVSAEGRAAVNLSLFPTSPLRRETFNLVLDESTSWDQLISVMHAAIEKLNGLSRTRVLLANWHLEGAGEVLASLQNEESQAELFELLAADDAALRDTLIEHRLCLQNREDVDPDPDGGRHHAQEDLHDDADETVSGGFRRRLDSAESLVGDVVRQLRQSDGDTPSPWTSRVEMLGSRVDPAAASTVARHLAEQWFAGEAVAESAVLAKPAVAVDTVASPGTEELNSVEETLDSIDEALGELDEADALDDGEIFDEADSQDDLDDEAADEYTEADAFYDNETASHADDDVDDFDSTEF